MPAKAIEILIRFDNGMESYAVGKAAELAWDYIESAQVMAAIHGQEYSGPVMESRKSVPPRTPEPAVPTEGTNQQ